MVQKNSGHPVPDSRSILTAIHIKTKYINDDEKNGIAIAYCIDDVRFSAG